MRWPLDREELARRQREADAWVRRRVTQGLDLYASGTAPTIGALADFLRPHEQDIEDMAVLEAIAAACDETSARRRQCLQTLGIAEAPAPVGRWLMFSPGFVDYCGLAYEPGFVDQSDAPGWDTWVGLCGLRGPDASGAPHYYRRETLLAWIPDLLEEKFGFAVRCSPLTSLAWLDEERNFHECTQRDLHDLGLV